MKVFQSIALALILTLGAPNAHAQPQTNKHVTSGEVKESFVGDGITKVFTLSFNPTGPAAVMVFLDGIYESEPEDYTIAGKVITFTAKPGAGQKIRVKYVAEFNG